MSATARDGIPYVDLGTSDNVAWDQPRVSVELIVDDNGTPTSIGPGLFNTMLLDTGSNSVILFATAIKDINGECNPAAAECPYETEGTFEEAGVAGTSVFDISTAYRFDFAGTSGVRNTLPDIRILSDADNDVSIVGPWGIIGMPTMVERVTTLDMTVWEVVEGFDLFMEVEFDSEVPQAPDPEARFTVNVDNRVSFEPEPHVTSGDNPPVWADVPFVTAYPMHKGQANKGDFLYDTGAQVSIFSTDMAIDIGLDTNADGVLDDQDANFARYETVGGIGGTVTAPVYLFDEVHIPTAEGVDLVWTDLQWLVLDILPGIDGVLGSDLLTSGWIDAFAVDGKSGWIDQVHMDFREMATPNSPNCDPGLQCGQIYYDLNEQIPKPIDPNGPGARIIEDGGSTTVSETGVQDSYQVVLTQQPAADVTISLSSPEGQVSAVAAAQPASQSLVFTPSNWDVPQTVLVTAVDDETVESFHRSSIYHVSSSSDPDYDDVGMPRVIVNIIDDDYAGVMIIPSDGSTDVAEGGVSDTYQVVLTKAPTEYVTIQLEQVTNQVVAVDDSHPSSSTLVFTPSNWNIPQTVRVTAVDDTLVEGVHEAYVTHRLSSADDEYQQVYALEELVTITDNDFPAIVLAESSGGTSVSESGSSDGFTVALDQPPLSNVVIAVASGDSSEATVDKPSLTFTPDNWDVPQTVTVTGVDEWIDDGDQATLVTLSADNGQSKALSVTTADDDVSGFTITESEGGTSVEESGAEDTFAVVLTSQPVADVVLKVDSGDVAEAAVSAPSLTFTPSNWNAPQTVTVTGVDEWIDDGDATTPIAISVDGGQSDDTYDPLEDQTVGVTTVDDDVSGFTITESDGGTSVEESGAEDTFAVVLTSQPVADVVLKVDSGDVAEAVVSAPSLTFTPSNWNTPQTVTVTGVDEWIDDGAATTPIAISVDGGQSDDTYDPLDDQTVGVTTVDDDVSGFTIIESDGGTSVEESGTADTFTVVLTSQPVADVVLNVESDDEAEAAVSASSLTFTPSNWNMPQTVTVTGVDEQIDDGDVATSITLSVDGQSDDTYDPLADQTVGVTTVDDDVAGFTIVESGGDTGVSEAGTTDALSVALNTQPTSDVVVLVASSDETEATVTPLALTFTAANWNSAQSLVVLGVDDGQPDGTQTATINVFIDDSESDDSYDDVPDQSVDVEVIENQSPVIASVEDQASAEDHQLQLIADISDVDHGAGDLQLTVISGDSSLLTSAGIQVSGGGDTRQVVLTPERDAHGTLAVTLRVEDAKGASSETVFSWRILPLNDAPVLLNPASNADVQAYDHFEIDLPQDMFVDPDGDVITTTAELAGGGALPAWLTFDPSSMRLSGMAGAAEEGGHTVRIRAEDDGVPVMTAVQDVIITVAPNVQPWHNHDFAEDVNDDGIVTPEDVVLVLGWLIAVGVTPRDGGPGFPPEYTDVVPDNLITSQDLLAVLSLLVVQDAGGEGEGAAQADAAAEVRLAEPAHAEAEAAAQAAPVQAAAFWERTGDEVAELPPALSRRRLRRDAVHRDLDSPSWQSLLQALAEDEDRATQRRRRRGA